MKDPLKESLDRIRVAEAEAIPVPAGALGKAGQLFGRVAPGVGLGLGAYDVYKRQQSGDTTGAAISGVTTAASTIPIIGTAAAILGMSVQALRDKIRTGSFLPGEEELVAAAVKDAKEKQSNTPVQTQPTTPQNQTTKKGFDPKVKEIQDKILAKDPNALPKYGADGIMGIETQIAMKKLGITAETQEDTTMTESEKIAALRARLEQINEGPMDWLKSGANLASDAWQGAKNVGNNFMSGLKGGGTVQPVNAAGQFQRLAPGAKTANQVGKTIQKNPGKTALATGAAGLAAGMAAGGAKPTAGGGGGGGGAKPAQVQPSGGSASGVDQKTLDELDQLARIIGKSQDPSAIELMGQYNAIRKGLPAPTPVPGEMDESIARYIKLVDRN